MRNLYSNFRVLPTFNSSRFSALNRGATSELQNLLILCLLPSTDLTIDVAANFTNHFYDAKIQLNFIIKS